MEVANKENGLMLSIIVPVYNAEKYVSRCLLTLVSQGLSGDGYEIICVDDGSNDDSAKIIKEIQQTYPQIIYLAKTNGGVSSARNKGLEIAQGKYVAFVDADDYVREGAFRSYIEKLEEENASIIRFGFKSVFDENVQVDNAAVFEIVTEKCSVKNVPSNCFVYIVERKIIEKAGLRFPEKVRIGEDSTFNRLLWTSLVQEKALRVNDRPYKYYINPNSASHRIDSFTAEWAEKRIEDKVNIHKFYQSKLDGGLYNKKQKKNIKRFMAQNSATTVVQLLRLSKKEAKDGIVRLKRLGMYPYGFFACALKYDGDNNAFTFSSNKTRKSIKYRIKNFGFNAIRMMLRFRLVFSLMNGLSMLKRKCEK